MKVEIHYCAQWNYQPEADSLSAELASFLPGIEIELFAEGKGIFDVVADGVMVFSKYKSHRFPDTDEVSELLKNQIP